MNVGLLAYAFLMRAKSFNKMKYPLADHVAVGALTCARGIFRFVPSKSLVAISKTVGTLGFYLVKKYRKRVIGNLTLALGSEKTHEDIRALAKEVFYHLAFSLLELVYMLAHASDKERSFLDMRIEGKENLDEALAKGNGVIALGAHFGSFFLLPSRLGTEGYSCYALLDNGKLPKFWKKLAACHEVLSSKPIPLKPELLLLKKCLACLHRNEIIYILADEQKRRIGIPVTFFGQKAFTPPGPAILSIRTGAPILPMFVVRENGMKRRLVIGKPITVEGETGTEKDIGLLTAQFTGVIEKTVREHPSQWAWLNRRWKVLPPDRSKSLPKGNPT